jgi:hypothetical protein
MTSCLPCRSSIPSPASMPPTFVSCRIDHPSIYDCRCNKGAVGFLPQFLSSRSPRTSRCLVPLIIVYFQVHLCSFASSRIWRSSVRIGEDYLAELAMGMGRAEGGERTGPSQQPGEPGTGERRFNPSPQRDSREVPVIDRACRVPEGAGMARGEGARIDRRRPLR